MERDRVDSASLDLQTRDYVASAAKSIVGAAPFVGSLFVELAGTIIPNQRLDRIAKFAQCLETKLAGLEQEFVRNQLTNENFTELMEESLRQAARSVTDERRVYIAALVANGLKNTDISFVESRHLLRVLSEVNDIEVIRLASYQFTEQGGAAFFETHKAVLEPILVASGSSQAEADRGTLQTSYDVHLQQIGLLNPRYNVHRQTGQFVVGINNDLEIGDYSLSAFGELLLRQLGIRKSGKT